MATISQSEARTVDSSANIRRSAIRPVARAAYRELAFLNRGGDSSPLVSFTTALTCLELKASSSLTLACPS